MLDIHRLRSWLFVPALRHDFIGKAAGAGAGVVLLDLEDSIPPPRKAKARAALPGSMARLAAAAQRVAVRINADDPADLAAARAAGAWAVVVPKVNSAAELRRLQASAGDQARPPLLVPTIETARGWIEAVEIARVSGVAGLMFGAGDFALDTGMGYHESVLAAPAGAVVIAARAAGLPAFGLPGPVAVLDDPGRFESITRLARSLGFAGTPVVHPRQVGIVERVFAPTEEEIERARRTVARFESSDGLPSADQGRLVEWPVYESALALLRSATHVDPAAPTRGQPQPER